ncbi:MAG TPA: aldehyde dehydrogenase family protein, partial [Thermoanaerobaculia bacterium]
MAGASVLQSFVGGRWRSSRGDRLVPDRNPSDSEDVIGMIPAGSPEDVDGAVVSAAAAGAAWRNLTGPARAEHLHRWAAAIAGQQEALAQAMTREVGKPISEARGEVARCVAILR